MTFDRHPYLKHSTAMPAHKDTKHPAGQVVNEEPGQRKLSDYIRSINRAQAFDDVVAENKLTFDQWLDEFYPYSERPDDPNYYFIVGLKEAWNTALTKGKL